MKKINILQIIVAVFICQATGFIGSIFTAPEIDGWYTELAKPIFNPPNWLFAPVWTILFTFMGISLYLIWQKTDHVYFSWAHFFFWAQLIVNVLWSYVFFGLHNLILAFSVICILWILILMTIVIGGKLNKAINYLLLPYLAWVSFAALLNYAIFTLN